MFRAFFYRLIVSATAWTTMGTVLRMGGGLFTLPIVLRVIPEAELGLYYTFLAVSGIALLLDLGFSQSVTRNTAFAMGGAKRFAPKGLPPISDDTSPNLQLLAILKQAIQIWYIVLATIILLLLLTLGSEFINRTIHDSSISQSLLYCWFLFAIGTALNFATSYWNSLLLGIGKVFLAARSNVVAQIITLVSTITFLLSGLGLWAFALSSLIGPLIGRELSRRSFFFYANLPEHSFSWKEAKSVYQDLWPMAWRQGLVMLGAFLITRANTIICTTQLGVNETSRYGLTLQLLGIVISTSFIPLSVVWPLIATLRIKGERGILKKLFFTRLYLGVVIAIVGVLILAYFANPMLHALGSNTNILPTTFTLLLGGILLLEQHHSAYGGLVLTENQNPFIVPALLSGLAVILLSSHWTAQYGVLGLIVAQGIVQALWNNWWTVARGIKGINSKFETPP